jgi:hypothetical protein
MPTHSRPQQPVVATDSAPSRRSQTPQSAVLLTVLLVWACSKEAKPAVTQAPATQTTAAAAPPPAAELPVAPTATAALPTPWQPPATLAIWQSEDRKLHLLPADAVRPLLDPDLRGPVAVQQLAWQTAATLWLTQQLLQSQLGDSERARIDDAARLALLDETSKNGSAEAWMRTQQRAGRTVEARRAEVWVEAALTAALVRQGDVPLDEKLVIDRWTKRAGRFATPAQTTVTVFTAIGTLAKAEAHKRLRDAAAALAAGQTMEAAGTANGLQVHRHDGAADRLERPLEQAVLATKPGQATAPVRTSSGWQLAVVTRLEPAAVLPLASARPLVEAQLRDEARVGQRRTLRAALLAAANVRWQPPLDVLLPPTDLALPAAPTSDTVPPGVPQ